MTRRRWVGVTPVFAPEVRPVSNALAAEINQTNRSDRLPSLFSFLIFVLSEHSNAQSWNRRFKRGQLCMICFLPNFLVSQLVVALFRFPPFWMMNTDYCALLIWRVISFPASAATRSSVQMQIFCPHAGGTSQRHNRPSLPVAFWCLFGVSGQIQDTEITK